MQDEAPQVAFFTLHNGTSTINFTMRAAPDETPDAFVKRVVDFLVKVDPTCSRDFKVKDVQRQFSGKGASKADAVAIKDNQFIITHVQRVERQNKTDPLKPWYDFHAFGKQDGQEVSAVCFVGSATYTRPGNAVTESGLFPNFASWIDGERRQVPPGSGWTAKVSRNEQFKRYEITAILQVAGM